MNMRSLSLMLVISIVYAYSAENETALVKIPMGGRETVEVGIPDSGELTSREHPMVLELKDVRFPKSAKGLRVFVSPNDGSNPDISSTYYVGSVAKGHPSPDVTSESFAFDLSKTLIRLDSEGKGDLTKGKTLRLSVEPISGPGSNPSETTEIGGVEMRRER